MKKARLAVCVGLLLVLLTPLVLAEEMATSYTPGDYAASVQGAAQEAGLEVYTETTLAWDGLPLLEEADNAALKSLLAALRLETGAWGVSGSGAVSAKVYLQDVSVFDITLMTQDGLYYEQSSALGGQTVAFSQEEFAIFMRRLSEQSEGILPQNLDGLFEVVVTMLGGMEAPDIETNTIDNAWAVYAAWADTALTKEERLRPDTYLPGIYGERAEVMDVTRAEAIALAGAIANMLSGEEALWSSAVEAALPEGDENEVAAMLASIAGIVQALPETVATALPEDIMPGEYREICGEGDELVARQVEFALDSDTSILVEWIPAQDGARAYYASVRMGESEVFYLGSHDTIDLGKTGSGVTKTQKRDVAQWTLVDGEVKLDIMMTGITNIQTSEGKETIDYKADWIVESAAVLGEGAVVTVTCKVRDTATGEGKAYVRQRESVWGVKGLGYGAQTVLTVTETSAVRQPSTPIDVEDELVRPASLEEEEFAQWLADMQVSLIQVGYTCLGRLPSSVAAYVLQQMQGE